ncbi:MAG: C69 family dipeptidase [Eggerthellaceae bacterium]|nr:C69 family dipeptidase [Eggerthellaceae bacterium]
MTVLRRFLSTLVVLVLAAFFACAVATPAEACTGVYVGPKVSADGSIIIARSNDTQGVSGNYIQVVDRVENKAGRTMPLDQEKSVFVEIPKTTYHYICTPKMDSVAAEDGLPHDAACCINEYGVAMTMSVTAFSNENVHAADPLVEHGITECSVDDLVVCQSKTAREAVETLLGLIDEYGSSEINIALIADQKEAWYIEMYSGHQYAAVRLPDDKVCAFGNEFQLEFLSDYDECIVSNELESMPKENGFAVTNEKGELNLFETYAGTAMTEPYCHMRTWIGHQILAPSVFDDDYGADTHYPLCFDPDESVSVQDVMNFMRNRYEGTPYSPDETGRTDMRVIGTDTAESVHIMQVYPDLPAEMSAVLWECTGPCIYGTFVPISNACAQASESYARNQPAEEEGVFDTANYPYYAIKGITDLCVEQDEYKVYGEPVKAYWAEAEAAMVETLSDVLEEAADMDDSTEASALIQAYCTGAQEQAFQDEQKLLNDVMWYHGENSNTLKQGKNPVTEEIYDELAPIDPMTVTLDASAYKK